MQAGMPLAMVVEVVSRVMVPSRPRAPGVGAQARGRERRLQRTGSPGDARSARR